MWLDAPYGNHPDLKGQTGATISIGKGCVTSASKKQKVNATILTISELVGFYEASPQLLWTNAFLQNQGFELNKETLYQVNMIAIMLEKNRRPSRSSRTKHIKIRYFFYPRPDRKVRHRVGIFLYRQDGGVFHDQSATRENIFEFRDHIIGISKSEIITEVRKVRDEIAQNENLQNVQTAR